jgi:hypothetical protein
MGDSWVAGGRCDVILACDCGKRYKTVDGVAPALRQCPQCGGSLRVVQQPVPASADVGVLIEQKKALRDEMRVRDRDLRIARVEINRLKAENEKLRAELSRARGGLSPITVSVAPVIVDRSADWRPMEMPSERLDLSLLPPLEELPNLDDAPQLPSDRLPLYSPSDE